MTAPTEHLQTAIDELVNIPSHWQLTPLGKIDRTTGQVNPKAPYLAAWQKTDVSLDELENYLLKGQATGYGLRLGEPSGYVMAIDFDGQSAINKALELFGELPATVSWTSGTPGRYQALFQVPEQLQQSVKTKKIETKPKDDGNKAEGLEFRYTNGQSVLPPSLHSSGNYYRWINSPVDTVVVELPQLVVDYWLNLCTPKVIEKKKTVLSLAPTHPHAPTASRVESSKNTAIPLSNCLAKSNIAVLGGVGEGGRNDTGATLARDLIGTANYLDSIGQQYIGDARDLFDRFCSGCNPAIEAGESETIWDSAQRDNPSPSCQTEGVDNILAAWNGKNSPATEDDKRRCPYFETSPAGGLWRVSLTKDDDVDGYDDESAPMKKKRDRIGNHLECIAYVDNPESSGAALYLEFQTVRNKTTKWTMPRGYIVSDTAAMLSELFNMGYQFKVDKKKYLIEYLAGLGGDVAKTYTIVDSTGWVNDRYVSQHKTYGDGDLKFRDIEPTSEATTEIKGSLDDWKTTVGIKCAGNSRLLLGLGVAFAAPLLAITGMESGGFHLVGDSSAGKTTTLKVAVSVTGEKHIPHWRTTTNGLEAIATAHNHSLLPLDEIAQADPRQVGEIAYMLANGQGKTRMTKSLTNRKPKTWELLFLSSGEMGMGAYMAQAGVTMKGGQEVRMPDIPAVPFGSPFGVFETIHGYESSKEFARSLESGSEQNRGVAIDVFLTRLLVDRSVAFDGELAARVFAVAKKLSEGTLNHAVSRVANRFGLIQVALELAHSYGILPFPVENIDWGIKKIFADWLTNRGGDGSIEIKNACNRIHHLIVSNEFSDRVFDPRKADGQIVRNLLGYRVADIDNRTLELLVPTTVFDKEFCDGVSKPQLIAELQARGWLAAPGSDGRSTHPRRVNGKLAKFLVFQPPNISDDAFSGVTGVTGVTAHESLAERDSDSQITVTPKKNGGVTGVTPLENIEDDAAPSDLDILTEF